MLVINASIVSGRPAGLEVVAREISKRLKDISSQVFVLTSETGNTSVWQTLCRWAWGRHRVVGGLPRFLWLQMIFPFWLVRKRVQCLLSPNHEVVLACPCPQIVIIHDLLPILFPLDYPRQNFYFRYVLPRVLARSRHIIAVSENTKKDLIRHFHLPSEKISVIYSGVDGNRFYPIVQRAEIPYILFVGNHYRYKNVLNLMRAFAMLARQGFPHRLIIVGREGDGGRPTPREAAVQLGVAESVSVLGYVAESELAKLYARADIFVIPSLYEGFGLPALEAMASGSPVVASNRGALPEICGDAARYFDPDDVEQMVSVLAGVLSDGELREKMRVAGLARAKLFDWDQTAKQYADVLKLT